MKRQIRLSVFESNSSSMHSLCVTKNNDKYTPEEIAEDFWMYSDKETGEEYCVWEPYKWNMRFERSPFKVLANFRDKWLYACASCEYMDDRYKELVALAKKYVPGLKKIVLPTKCVTIYDKNNPENKDDDWKQKIGKTEEEFIKILEEKALKWGDDHIDYWKNRNGNFCYWEPDTGYTESCVDDFLKRENITLEEFLTSKKYIMICDGDEYCVWDDLKKAGLVNLKVIDHENES